MSTWRAPTAGDVRDSANDTAAALSATLSITGRYAAVAFDDRRRNALARRVAAATVVILLVSHAICFTADVGVSTCTRMTDRSDADEERCRSSRGECSVCGEGGHVRSDVAASVTGASLRRTRGKEG